MPSTQEESHQGRRFEGASGDSPGVRIAPCQNSLNLYGDSGNILVLLKSFAGSVAWSRPMEVMDDFPSCLNTWTSCSSGRY